MWQLPAEQVNTAGTDPWVKRLVFAAAGCVLLAVVLFGFYKFSLGSGVDRMQTLSQARG
jgi:hypothetical protein